MTDRSDPSTSGKQDSAHVLGRDAFEHRQEKIRREAASREKAIAARRQAMQKRLLTRMLDREKQKPRLRIVR